MERDLRGQPRVRHGARSDHGVFQFHVALGVFVTEAHSVNGNVPGAQRVDRVGADAARVIAAVAEQHHGTDRQVGRFVHQLLQSVAEARGGRGRLHVLQIINASERAIDAIQTRLKRLVQVRQHAVLQRLYGLCFARDAVLVDRHAAGIVHHYGDDVLLGLKLGHGDRGLPQQHQHQRGEQCLQAPDQPGSPTAHHRRRFRQAGADQPCQRACRCKDEQNENPFGPRSQERELSVRIDRLRIFKKELEHGTPGAARRGRGVSYLVRDAWRPLVRHGVGNVV